MSSELIRHEVIWKSDIRTVSYLGELALERSAVDSLCSELGTNAAHSPMTLTVLAVNCAYYYLDNDGFWTHFCAKLGVDHSSANTQILGYHIEKYLKTINKRFRERFGPNRYVGAILEQSGITRKQLPKFVDFLRDLGRRYKWDGVLGLDYNRYRLQIPTVGSKYLLNFLHDESGWEFVKDVARHLSQHERGLVEISELEKVKGYHPSFWAEVTGLLKLSQPKAKAKNVPLPILAFDSASNSIQLRFDSDCTRKGMYQLDGKILIDSFYQLNRSIEAAFKDSYNIEVLIEDSWLPVYLQGWIPKNSEFAFFHEEKGYIHDPNRLKPGNYWLVTIRSMVIPEELILTGPETLSLYCGYFSVYEVCVAQYSDLSVFGVTSIEPTTPDLSYAGMAMRLEYSADARTVFTGQLPTIQINNSQSLINGEYILVADAGGIQKRVPLEFYQNSSVDLKSIGFKFPGKGSLWIEATGRNATYAGERIIDRLDFIAIECCKIDGPNYLISCDDEVKLELTGPDNYTLELAEGTQIDEVGHRWSIARNVHIVEGVLHASGMSIRIAYRLHRANLIFPGATDTLFAEDLDSNLPVIAEGVPNNSFGLYIAASTSLQKICPPAYFNKVGRYELSTFSFRDAILSQKIIAGRFELGRPDGTVPTSNFYLNLASSCSAICSADSEEYDAKWMEYLSPAFRSAFRFLYDIARGRTLTSIPIRSDLVPQSLGALMDSFVACAQTLDGAQIRFIDQSILSPNVNAILEWYEDTNVVTKGIDDLKRVKDLVANYPARIDLPLKRWNQQVEAKYIEIHKIVKLDENLGEIIEIWAAEVKDGIRRENYAGHIANLSHGAELVDSWKLYFNQNNPKGAYLAAKKIIDKSDGLVCELARLLAMTMLAKLNQTEEIAFHHVNVSNKFLAPFFNALLGENNQVTDAALNTLPLRSEDKVLFR
jgi:hypothetical protein